MSQQLSTSVTFRTLTKRVDDLAAGSFAGDITVGGDSNFRATFSVADPLLIFDTTDYLAYSRSFDIYQFVIGNYSRFNITAGGVSADLFQAPIILASGVNGAGSIRMLRSSTVGFTGSIEFLKSDSARNGYVGFNAEPGAMQYGSDTGAGHNFVGGPIMLDDANIGLKKVAGDPVLMCDANDYLYYSRSANKFIFVIGGVNVASIDASGNMRLKGTLAQSVTP